MSSDYMSTDDSLNEDGSVNASGARSEDSLGADEPDPAAHLRTSDDVPAADAAIVGRPDLQPDSQGDVPLAAELGEDGQGDLAEGDEHLHSGDAPDDLRVSGPSGEVHEERP